MMSSSPVEPSIHTAHAAPSHGFPSKSLYPSCRQTEAKSEVIVSKACIRTLVEGINFLRHQNICYLVFDC